MLDSREPAPSELSSLLVSAICFLSARCATASSLVDSVPLDRSKRYCWFNCPIAACSSRTLATPRVLRACSKLKRRCSIALCLIAAACCRRLVVAASFRPAWRFRSSSRWSRCRSDVRLLVSSPACFNSRRIAPSLDTWTVSARSRLRKSEMESR